MVLVVQTEAESVVRRLLQFLGKLSSNLIIKGNIMNAIKKFLREEDGVTAIEYGLIAALIAVLIISALSIIGTQLQKTFSYIATQLSNAVTAGT